MPNPLAIPLVPNAAVIRIWRGRTAPERADEYEQYNFDAGLVGLRERAQGVQSFRADHPTYSEFMTISYWASEAEMSAYSSGDPTEVHHLERDAEFQMELPQRVEVFSLRTSHGDCGANSS